MPELGTHLNTDTSSAKFDTGGPRLRISMRRSGDGDVVAPVRSGAAEEFFSRVHAENAPHLQEDVDAGAAESVTGAARPHDVRPPWPVFLRAHACRDVLHLKRTPMQAPQNPSPASPACML